MVVPNAGFDVDSGEWKTGSGVWLAPVKVLASFFRRRFLEDLARAHGNGELEFHGTVAHLANPGEFHASLAAARGRDWVVYAKRPFRGPEQVFRYLARYTHRIAISDRRIVVFDGENVTFRYRKPAEPGQKKPRYGTMTVSADEFIRRFLLHVLREGMHRIRYFGVLANSCRATTLECAREVLGTVGCAVSATVRACPSPPGAVILARSCSSLNRATNTTRVVTRQPIVRPHGCPTLPARTRADVDRQYPLRKT